VPTVVVSQDSSGNGYDGIAVNQPLFSGQIMSLQPARQQMVWLPTSLTQALQAAHSYSFVGWITLNTVGPLDPPPSRDCQGRSATTRGHMPIAMTGHDHAVAKALAK
jgi:hypothetical protein